MTPIQTKTRAFALASLAAGALLLTSCATPGVGAASDTADDAPSAAATPGGNETEVAHLAPRILVAHGGGLTLLDGESGQVLAEDDRDGFLRLNDAGDGRHVVVTDGDLFRVYDTGIHAKPHGDHDHYFTSDPGMTGAVHDAPHAGHVVVHEGRTSLFADGTGEARTLASDAIADPEATVDVHRSGAAHHGVAIELGDGTLLATAGTEDERHTVAAFAGGAEIAKTTDCPGVHGEAAAAPTASGDVAVFGCENGPVVWRDGAFHKVGVDDAYARTGNLAGHHASPVVLGDYKTDADAEHEHPTTVALIDTVSAKLTTHDLGSAYWFRSLARGEEGEALVLTADGSLRVLDPTTGAQKASIDVIEAWTEPEEWQQPGPALKVAGDVAYVSDPTAGEVVLVDLHLNEVIARFDVPTGVTELAVTTGSADSAPASEQHGHSH